MRKRLEARGSATKVDMWEAYADLSRWPAWAPQIREVRPCGRIHLGLRGEVVGILGIRASFEVTDVDQAAGSWAWRVRIGPAHLAIAHEVSDGMTAVEISGSAPLVLAYQPIARLALARLVMVTPSDHNG